MHCVCYCSSVIDYYPPLFVCLLVGGPGGLRLTFKYIDFLQICFCLHSFDFLSVFWRSQHLNILILQQMPSPTSNCFPSAFSNSPTCSEWSLNQGILIEEQVVLIKHENMTKTNWWRRIKDGKAGLSKNFGIVSEDLLERRIICRYLGSQAWNNALATFIW